MTAYVLVPGAWHGAWAWARLAEELERGGHRVHAVSLTGVGERAHLASPDVGLHTHVDDVLAVLHDEPLDDVVLVGHSYAGLVVRQAADAAPERVRSVILVDGWAGRDGESLLDRAPDWFRDMVRSLATETDGIQQIVPLPAELLGVDVPEDQAMVDRLLTPHPLRTFTDRTRLAGHVDDVSCTQIHTLPSLGVPFDEWAIEFGWDYRTIGGGHDAMITRPAELAHLVLDSTPAA